MSRVNSIHSFYGVWLITSIGFNLGLGGPLYAAVSQWFVKKRGVAIAFTKIGFSIGGGIMPTILTYLLFMFGWQQMFVIMGILEWMVLLPLSWFFVKPHRPEYYGVLPDGHPAGEELDSSALLKAGEAYAQEAGEVEFTARQAYRTRAFWLTVLAFAIRGMVASVVTMHTIPLLTDAGWDPLSAAAGFGLLVVISLPGRLLAGVLSDRMGVARIRYIFVIGLVGILISFTILLNAGTNVSMLYAFLVVYGVVGLAFPAATHPIILGRYFGRRAYSTIDGTKSLITGLIGIIAPVYAGWVFDVTGSYRGAFSTLYVLVLLGIVVTVFAKPPPRPR
jgi:sugar phosphate permease